MFCKYCGTPSETDVCPNCAAKQAQPKPQPQAQPKAQNATGAGDIIQLVKTNLHYIIAGIAVLAFIWGILNVFSVFHVNAKAKAMGERESEYISVSDFAEGMDSMDSSAATVYIGNIIFGLACLAVAAIGVLYFLKVFKNMPYYDQFIGSKLQYRPAFMMGALGAGGALLQMIFYLFCSTKMGFGRFSIKLSAGVNWTTWLMLVLFAALAVVDKFVLEEKQTPAPEEQAEAQEAPVAEQ